MTLPKPLRFWHRIDLLLLPPCLLATLIVQGPVMQPAQRHGEGVARLQTEATRLQVLQVMGLSR